MAHAPQPESRDAASRIPILPVEAPPRTPEWKDDPDNHDAEPHGFSIGESERAVAGMPPERRPLTRRDIRAWTVASLVGGVLFWTVVAGMLVRGGDDARDSDSTAPRDMHRVTVPDRVGRTLQAGEEDEGAAKPREARPEAEKPAAQAVPLGSLPRATDDTKGESAAVGSPGGRRVPVARVTLTDESSVRAPVAPGRSTGTTTTKVTTKKASNAAGKKATAPTTAASSTKSPAKASSQKLAPNGVR